MSAIATLTPEALQQPLTIVPLPSTENGEVLFCNLYQNGKQVFAPYDEQTNWKAVSRTALNVVRMANPDLKQSTQQPVTEAAAA